MNRIQESRATKVPVLHAIKTDAEDSQERRDEDEEGGREGRKNIYVISQVGIYFRFFLLL